MSFNRSRGRWANCMPVRGHIRQFRLQYVEGSIVIKMGLDRIRATPRFSSHPFCKAFDRFRPDHKGRAFDSQ
jgi:hypothetical protein